MLWNADAVVGIVASGALCAASFFIGRQLRTSGSSAYGLLQVGVGAFMFGALIEDALPQRVGAGSVAAAVLLVATAGFYSTRVERTEEDIQKALHTRARRALVKGRADDFTRAIAEIRDIDFSWDVVDGYPPLLHQAVQQRALPFVHRLIEAGADVNRVDVFRGSISALHIAAGSRSEDCVNALLEAGALVDPVDQWGCTPLRNAAVYHGGHAGIVRLLLRAGADPSHRDSGGRTALDWATMGGSQDQNAEVVAALRASAP